MRKFPENPDQAVAVTPAAKVHEEKARRYAATGQLRRAMHEWLMAYDTERNITVKPLILEYRALLSQQRMNSPYGHQPVEHVLHGVEL